MNEKLSATRDGFGEGMIEIGHLYSNVVALCADLTESMRLKSFQKEFPARFFEVGVAEQNLAGLAAGLALGGKKPFAASYAVFHPGNSWGVIRASIAYSDLPVVIVGGHTGLGTGPDGATHQALEDIALMRSLPNMSVVAPSDSEQARQAVHFAATYKHPLYLRLGRHSTATIRPEVPFSFTEPRRLREGGAGVVLSYGDMIPHIWEALEQLPPEKQPILLDVPVIKPLPIYHLLEVLKSAAKIVVVENHQQYGGLGELLSRELLLAGVHAPFFHRAVADSFGESGTAEELFNHHGLSIKKLTQFLAEVL